MIMYGSSTRLSPPEVGSFNLGFGKRTQVICTIFRTYHFFKKKTCFISCYFFIWRATLKCLSIKFHWTFFELRHSTCSTLIAAPKREKGRRLNSSMPHQSGVLHTVVYMKQNGLGWKQTNSKRLLPHRQMVSMSLSSLIHSHILVLTPVSHT